MVKRKNQAHVPRNSWKSLDYTLAEATKVIQEQDCPTLPTQEELGRLGYSSLSVAISKYHGGFPRFRKLLGEDPKSQPYNLWKDKKFTLEKARQFMKEQNIKTLPCSQTIRDLGYTGLSNAIQRYHGGFREFRGLLGEEQRKLEEGKLQDRKYVLQQLKRIMRENRLKTIPSSTQLRYLGYGSLDQAIYKYHGGMSKLRKSVGENPRKHKDGSWQNLDFVLEQAEALLNAQKLGELPSHLTLIKYSGGPMLSRAIVKYHGGFEVFRQTLREFMNLPSKSDRLESLLNSYVGER